MEIRIDQLKDLIKVIKKPQKIVLLYSKEMKIPGFIVKNGPETTIVLSCNNVVNMNTGRMSFYASSDKPSNACLGLSIKNRKSIVRTVSKDGCCISSITGTSIMKIVHCINKKLGIRKSQLEDHSHVTIGKYSVRLAILSLIKYSKTWYEKNGYQLTKKGKKLKKKFILLSTNNVIKFLNKCQTIKTNDEKIKSLQKDLKNLIPTFLDKKYYNRSFQKTLQNIITTNVKNILWCDFILNYLNRSSSE